MTAFKITDPVFKTEPLFILGCTPKELNEYMLRRFHCSTSVDSNDSDTTGTMLTYKVKPWRVVWTLEYPRTAEQLGTLCHEIFHLVTRICGDKGIPIKHHIEGGECGDEAAAYLYEFFVTQILKRLRRNKVK